jgi:hypothetical protein
MDQRITGLGQERLGKTSATELVQLEIPLYDCL